MIRLLWVFLLVLSVSPVLAQSKEIDSLRAVLARHPQTDTFRVNRLNDLVMALAQDQGPPAKEFRLDSISRESIRVAKQINYPFGEARAVQLLAGLNTEESGKPESGRKKEYQQLLLRALTLARRSGNKELITEILLQIGGTLPKDRQRTYFQQALAVARASHDPDLIFDTHTGIISMYSGSDYAVALQWALPLLASTQKTDTNKLHQYKIASTVAELYTSLNDYDQALTYYKQSQQVARKRQDGVQEGAAFCRIGELFLDKNQPDKAIEALKRGLSLVEGRREDWVAKIQVYLAEAYQRQQTYQQTFDYAHQALATMKGSTFQYRYYYPGFRPIVWLALSQAQLHTNRLDSALYYANLCLPMVKNHLEFNKLKFPRDVFNVLAQVYAKEGNYTQAYAYQSQYIRYRDSLNNEEVTRKATALRFNDQMSRQQSQITLLQKDQQLQAEEARRQRLLLYTSLVVLSLIGGLLALFYRNNRQKQRANALLQQQKVEIQTQRDQTQQALTELKTTQTQLVQKEKMASLGELTAGIAHEIQNPLNFVNNFSEVSAEMVDELAQEQQSLQPNPALQTELLTDLKDNLHKILHHGQRASNIVKGMLEHSRNSTGDKQPTDLNALCEEYLRLAYHGLRAKNKTFNAELTTNFATGLAQVEVVPQELGRVLLNLYNNAFYAVQQRQQAGEADYRPTLTVSTHRQNEQVEIRVADNGTGIPDAVKAKIFQPFFTTKPTGQGTGLGLSLSYDIVTKGHKGALIVESQPDKGTTFIVTLPT